jgi:hypothetical protein
MKLGMYIMASEPMSAACFISPSHQFVYPPVVAGQGLGKIPPIVAGQQLSKNVTAAMNTHTKIKELLDASFSVLSVSCQGK